MSSSSLFGGSRGCLENECLICLEELNDDDDVIQISYGTGGNSHCFHRNHLQEYLQIAVESGRPLVNPINREPLPRELLVDLLGFDPTLESSDSDTEISYIDGYMMDTFPELAEVVEEDEETVAYKIDYPILFYFRRQYLASDSIDPSNFNPEIIIEHYNPDYITTLRSLGAMSALSQYIQMYYDNLVANQDWFRENETSIQEVISSIGLVPGMIQLENPGDLEKEIVNRLMTRYEDSSFFPFPQSHGR